MKKTLKKVLRWTGIALLLLLAFLVVKRLLWGRWSGNGAASGQVPELQCSLEEAMSDGVISEEELVTHYAPEILAGVNVLLSGSGKGDFLAAADYDGDLNAQNNWENLTRFPLKAYVYYSLQETETHYYLGYYFYHPRDDAEIWLDKHENDFEGILLTVRKEAGTFGTLEVMYTQGHGKLPFYFDNPAYAITEGSRYAGGLEVNNGHPVIYITPNGTLDYAGHSVESAKDHSTYFYVGNSGIYYYNGGVAEVPSTYNGEFRSNPCSYRLLPLEELYQYRNGPYGEGNLFGEFGAFCGNNYEENAANPAWGWRNKTEFGFSGSFLSDPAWTVTKAVSGLGEVSHEYVRNDYAEWKITVTDVTVKALPAGTELWVCIARDGWPMSNAAWWSAVTEEGVSEYPVSFGDIDTIYLAAAADWSVEVYVCDGDGNRLSPEQAEVHAEITPLQ